MASTLTTQSPTKVNIPNSGPVPIRVGSQLAEYVFNVEYNSSSNATYLEVLFGNDTLFGSFVVMEIFQTTGLAAVNADDVDFEICPAVREPNTGKYYPSQVGFYKVVEAADLSNPNEAHSYSLSNWHAALTTDQRDKHIQGRGFFIKIAPAAAMTADLQLRILVR